MSLELTVDLVLASAAAATLVLAFLLSAAFRRGRAALAALVLLWAWTGLALASGTLDLGLPTPPRSEALLLCVPLNLLFLACIVETVVLSRTGLLLLLLLVVQGAAAWLLPPEYWDALWRLERMPARWLGDLFAARGLPPPGFSAGLGLLAAAVAALRARRAQDPVLSALACVALLSGWLGYGLLLGFAADVPLLLAGVALISGAGWASYRMAFLDALTGLPGRRVLDERMARLGRRWAVAMIDVDHFKKFNDTYGHDVGDQVLRMVATKLRQHFGADAFRYGGEEFSVLFTGRSEREAAERCDAFREDVAGHGMLLRAEDRPAKAPRSARKGAAPAAGKGAAKDAGKAASKGSETSTAGKGGAGKGGAGKGKARKPPAQKPVTVTVSVGIARRTAQRRRPEVVLKAADVALYAAKKGGRNRVEEDA